MAETLCLQEMLVVFVVWGDPQRVRLVVQRMVTVVSNPEQNNGVDEWKTMKNEFGNNEERLKRRKEERTEKKGERQERERKGKL